MLSKSQQAMLASYGRSFLAAATASFMATGGDLFALDMDTLKGIVAAGVASVLPVALRALNPNDPAFGKVADAVSASAVKAIKKPAKKTAKKK